MTATAPPPRSRRAAFLIGFGIATLSLWVGITVLDLLDLPILIAEHWLIAAAIAGALATHRWKMAGLGVAASLAALILVDAWTVPPGDGEWSGLDKMFWRLSLAGASLVGFVVAWLGSRLTAGRSVPRWLSLAAAGVGLMALGGVVLTGLWLLILPAERSFAISLPAGWTVVERDSMWLGADETYGSAFTAVKGHAELPSDRPEDDDWLSVPAVGVSVTRGVDDPEGCYQAWDDGWRRSDSPLYRAPAVLEGPAIIGAVHGFVHESIREEVDGSRVYGYGIVRDRWVGLVRERVCYLLVVSVPAGSQLSSDEVDLIVNGFAFAFPPGRNLQPDAIGP